MWLISLSFKSKLNFSAISEMQRKNTHFVILKNSQSLSCVHKFYQVNADRSSVPVTAGCVMQILLYAGICICLYLWGYSSHFTGFQGTDNMSF